MRLTLAALALAVTAGAATAAEVARLLRGLRPTQIALVGACMRDTAVAYTGDAAGWVRGRKRASERASACERNRF